MLYSISLPFLTCLTELLHCRVLQPPAWSNYWPQDVDDDASINGVQSSPFTRGHSNPDDIISTLYAHMLIAETGRTMEPPVRDDYWSAEVGLSAGRSFGVGNGMSASGGSSAETGSFVLGPGGGGVLADLYDNDVGGGNGDVDSTDNCWNAFSGFFDGSFSSHRLPAGLGAAVGDDDSGTSTGPWRLKPDAGVSAVIGGGSCGSDGATSPSHSPAESSTGSAA